MKYKVVKPFTDKETMEKQAVNTEYTPSSKKRGDMLVSQGFIVEVAEPKKKATKKGADSGESGTTE